MIKEDIINFWNFFDDRTGFRLVPFIVGQNVSLGYDSEGFKSMFIDLPAGIKVSEPSYKLENISLSVEKKYRKYLILTLKDDDFTMIFNEFLFALFSQINREKEVDNVIRKVVELYHVWNLFFSKEKLRSVNMKKLLGVAGELYYLDYFLDNHKNGHSVIESWEGPSNKTHDFIFTEFDLEVKAKMVSSNVIHISSGFQLDFDKYLKLGVVNFTIWDEEQEDPYLTISLMVRNIVEKLKQRGLDHILFLNKLLQMNIHYFDDEQMEELDNIKFVINSHQEYDASHELFPRLVTANIPIAIKRIKYDLDLNLIEEFKI